MGTFLVGLSELVDVLANGLVFGSVLALGAIGLSLIYGILSLSNFAHGDFLTFGALMAIYLAVEAWADITGFAMVVAGVLVLAVAADWAWTRRTSLAERVTVLSFAVLLGGLALWNLASPSGPKTTVPLLLLGALLSVGLTVALTVGLDVAIWRPLRRRRATVLTLIIVSIGLALVVRNALQLYFGGGLLSFDRPTPESHEILGARISEAQQIAFLTAVLAIGVVHLFLKKTRAGKAMRALADNLDLARVSGIDVERVLLHVWALAGALIAVAGVLLTLAQNNTITVNTGSYLLLPLFAAVILGGIGSAYGAMVGAFVVGIATKSAVLWLGTEYELAAAFIVLIVALFVRPQGIFGVRS